MSMTINTNISSLNAQRNLGKTQSLLSRSLSRLSSGLRINSAKDDAAGLAIANRMTSQIRGLNQAVRNANDGISLAQTAEGAMQEIGNNLQRIRELAIQAASDSNSASDRQSLNAEVTQLVAEINRVTTETSFNGTKLLDGTFGSKNIQVGAEQGQTISVSLASVKADSLGVGSGSSYSTSITGAAVNGTALSVGDLTINGYEIGAGAADGVSYVNSDASALAVANAINARTGDTGVTATVSIASVDGTTISAGNVAIAAGDILINGVDIGAVAVGASAAAVEHGADVAAAINAVSNQTGVTATFSTSTGAVALTSIDGRNITVTTASGVLGTQTGLGSGDADGETATTYSSVDLSSASSAGITIGGAAAANAGLDGSLGYSAATATAGAGISSLDLTTAAGAGNAISIVDAALATIDSARGELGAIQNRFESTINNLQNVSENVSAARSRVMDADFAAETAEMTKAQVMQQAGVAMLAQANLLPQTVLSLLQ